MKNITEALEWRYATKKFDTSKKLTETQLNMLIRATQLAPSSFGLTPYRILVVSDPAVRQKLRAAAWNQAQITDASHLFIFAANTALNDNDIDQFIQLVANTRKVSLESLADYSKNMKAGIAQRPGSENTEWAARQAYIALGVLMAAASTEGIDVCPMEGFDPKQFDEILGLTAMNLSAKVIGAAGFRAADDPYQKLAKVRFPTTELVKKI